MQPTDLLKLSKEKLVEKLYRFNVKYDEAMQIMVMIREELLHRLVKEHKDAELIGEYAIAQRTRVNCKTSLEKAREFGAVKDAVDTVKLIRLYKSGAKIPDITETIYLSVRRISQDEQE